MKDSYISTFKLLYKFMKRHFHIHVWLLQYFHNASIVPDGGSTRHLRKKKVFNDRKSITDVGDCYRNWFQTTLASVAHSMSRKYKFGL